MSSNWRITICRVLLCVKLLGITMCRGLLCVELLSKYNLHVFALCQAIGSPNLQGIELLLCPKLLGEYNSMYLQHAPHVARPVNHIAQLHHAS